MKEHIKFHLEDYLWILWCCILGFIGWLLHDQNLYQPLIVWLIGYILFTTITAILELILASITTSFFFKSYTNVIKLLAIRSAGINPPAPSKTSSMFATGLFIAIHLTANLYMAVAIYYGNKNT